MKVMNVEVGLLLHETDAEALCKGANALPRNRKYEVVAMASRGTIIGYLVVEKDTVQPPTE